MNKANSHLFNLNELNLSTLVSFQQVSSNYRLFLELCKTLLRNLVTIENLLKKIENKTKFDKALYRIIRNERFF